MTEGVTRRLGYVPALDGVRAFAVLAVIGVHLNIRYFRFGYIGVTVFFVLSGFLITTVLLEEWHLTNSIRLLGFYRRRALRLLPAATLLVLVSLLPFNPNPFADRAKAALMTSVYVANWAWAFPSIKMGSLTHTWSLSLEEQFYLLWAPMLIGLLYFGWTRFRLTSITCLLIVVACGIRLVLVWSGSPPLRIYYGLDTRASGLLIGCLAAATLSFHRDHPVVRSGRMRLAIALALAPLAIYQAIYFSWNDRADFIIGYPVVETLSVLLILTLVLERESWLSRVLEMPALVWAGRISYGLYLWHWLVIYALATVPMHPIFRHAVVLGVTFSAAAISYYAVERPFLRLKARPA